VYRHGKRAGDGLFAVNALANELGFARLGMSVSTRSVGNSVRRNRVRRIIREHFRERSSSLRAAPARAARRARRCCRASSG